MRLLPAVALALSIGCQCGGQPPVGGPCTLDSECGSGRLCVEQKCAESCSRSHPCPQDQTCLDGVCVAPDSGTTTCSCPDGGVCVSNTCYYGACFGTLCPPGQLCVDDVCIDPSCAGVVCPTGQRCAQGACLADSCGGAPCPPGEVCSAGSCTDTSCVNVTCPPTETCANGQCKPTACGAMTCGPGTVCVSMTCVDAACVGITCTLGGACVQGICRFPGCGSATCAAGFVCTASGQCRPPACAATACPQGQLCNGGQCFPTSCGTKACAPGEVCDQARCVPLDCAGISCPAGSACANGGTCLPTRCGAAQCPGTYVCSMGQCTDPRCVGVACAPGSLCSQGTCWPIDGCASGRALIRGACREPECEGVTCPGGQACAGGFCAEGVGVYTAGWLQPGNTTTQTSWEGVVARYEGGRWVRLNRTPLPPLKQLGLSPDGTRFYAATLLGGFWVSDDGLTWLERWQGTTMVTGSFNVFAVSPLTGTVYGAIEAEGDLGRFVYSTDRGESWSHLWQPFPGSFGGRSWGSGVAASPVDPAVVYVSYYCGCTWGSKGFARSVNGGASFSSLFDTALLDPGLRGAVAHPSDPMRAYAVQDSLKFEDGGISGPFNTCQHCITFKRGAPQVGFATSGANVFKTTNDGVSWGPRNSGITGGSVSGITLGPDDALYIGNTTGAEPLVFKSIDDAETWLSVGRVELADSGLADPWPAWQPDAAYTSNSRVAPTAPNGFIYRNINTSTSGGTEPAWKTDGGVTQDGTLNWAFDQPERRMRVNAVAARSCPLGDVLCGQRCTTLSSDPSSCGVCGRACALGVGCFGGSCLGAFAASDAGTDAGTYVGPGIGCADGTREGFHDVAAWPNVAACAGAWAGELTSTGADAVCGTGWHVCSPQDTAVLTTIGYTDAVAFPGCFAYRASNDFADGCEVLACTPGSEGRDDVAGVGSGCALTSGVSISPAQVPASQAGGCLKDKGIIDAECCAISDPAKMAPRPAGCLQRSESGVLCCH